jgi:protein SFI1
LDEGYGDESFETEGERSIDRDGREASDRDAKGRKSMVGYTPSQSLEYDTSFNPPARSSTPLYVQQDHRGWTTPKPIPTSLIPTATSTPPPYSLSDVSGSLDVSDYTTSTVHDRSGPDLDLISNPGTPRALRGTPSQSRWEEERVAEKVVKEMERRAIEFHETGLVGRCFDVWAQANDWVVVCPRVDPADDRIPRGRSISSGITSC